MEPHGDPSDAPPLGGLWLPLDPLFTFGGPDAAIGAMRLAAAAEFTGATLSLDGLVAAGEAAMESLFGALDGEELPLRLDLDSSSERTVTRALEESPDALCLPTEDMPEGAVDPWLDHLGDLDRLAAREETAVVLELAPTVPLEIAETILRWAGSSASVLALRLPSFSEEMALAASGNESLGLMGPEFRAATAVRHGMTGFDGWLPLLGPVGSRVLLGEAHQASPMAVQWERRVERWWEGPFERATRGLSDDEAMWALAGASGWLRGLEGPGNDFWPTPRGGNGGPDAWPAVFRELEMSLMAACPFLFQGPPS